MYVDDALPPTELFTVMDNPISRYINGHTPVYVIYGIGHSGIEVWSITFFHHKRIVAISQ